MDQCLFQMPKKRSGSKLHLKHVIVVHGDWIGVNKD